MSEPHARSRKVLAALVREYIQSGEPVASALLVAAAGLGVSSATVRNILARLEEEGFVQQPHTSAGRIPTDRGYRVYVDMLLHGRRPSRSGTMTGRIRRDPTHANFDSVLAQATHVLSEGTRQVGFAIQPENEGAVFDRVEFVPLSAARVLVVIVARGGHIIQKFIDTGAALTHDDLRAAANYLNAEFSGLPLNRARHAVLERMLEERMLYDALMARALRLAESSFSDLPDDRSVFVEGTPRLLDDATLGEHGLTLQTLQTLLQMMEEKQRLVNLLNEYIDGPGVTVVIGAEHQDPTLKPFSLVASSFDGGTTKGTVGVIGPTRMNYSRSIAVVDETAQAVSRLLRDAD